MGKARKGVWSKNNWKAGGRDLKSSWSIPICGQKSVRKKWTPEVAVVYHDERNKEGACDKE